MQGCVHATRRAQSGLGSASRPAYSSIRCEAAAQAANRRGGSGRGPLGRPHLAGMRCVATRKPRAARRARSGLGPASWPADSSLAKQGCPGGPHRRARRPRAGPSAGPQARSGLGQTSRRAHIKARCEARLLLLQSTARRRRQRKRRVAVASATTPLPPTGCSNQTITIRSRRIVSRTIVSHKQTYNNKSNTQFPGGRVGKFLQQHVCSCRCGRLVDLR